MESARLPIEAGRGRGACRETMHRQTCASRGGAGRGGVVARSLEHLDPLGTLLGRHAGRLVQRPPPALAARGQAAGRHRHPAVLLAEHEGGRGRLGPLGRLELVEGHGRHLQLDAAGRAGVRVGGVLRGALHVRAELLADDHAARRAAEARQPGGQADAVLGEHGAHVAQRRALALLEHQHEHVQRAAPAAGRPVRRAHGAGGDVTAGKGSTRYVVLHPGEAVTARVQAVVALEVDEEERVQRALSSFGVGDGRRVAEVVFSEVGRSLLGQAEAGGGRRAGETLAAGLLRLSVEGRLAAGYPAPGAAGHLQGGAGVLAGGAARRQQRQRGRRRRGLALAGGRRADAGAALLAASPVLDEHVHTFH